MGSVEQFSREAWDCYCDSKKLEGLTPLEKLQMKYAGLNLVEKSLKIQLAIYLSSAKYGKGALKQMTKKGFIDDGLVIDVPLDQIESERHYCKAKNKDVSRAECKEYSGSQEGRDGPCPDCPSDKITRRLLTNRQPMIRHD